MSVGPSKTALLVAGYRARATETLPDVCNDPWAKALAGDEGAALSRAYDEVFPPMELWLAVRTAFLDAQVRHYTSLAEPVRQVVVLGAGLDTRAARLGGVGVRFFEVDRPDTQADKLARLRALEGYPIEAATYVSCDFEHQDFLERLRGAGFDPTAPALVIWEGVVYYLGEAAVRATLERIARGCAPSSVLVFDYVLKRMAEGQRIDESQRKTRELLEALYEPIKFGVNDPLPMLHHAGFRHVRTLSFDQACLSITGTYDRGRMFRFQSLAVCSVARPFQP